MNQQFLLHSRIYYRFFSIQQTLRLSNNNLYFYKIDLIILLKIIKS